MPKPPTVSLTSDAYTTVINTLRDRATMQNAQWPQYEGHWNGPEWVLVQVPIQVKTKKGVAFVAGELALAKLDTLEGEPVWTAYSVSNCCDTVISLKKAFRVEVEA